MSIDEQTSVNRPVYNLKCVALVCQLAVVVPSTTQLPTAPENGEMIVFPLRSNLCIVILANAVYTLVACHVVHNGYSYNTAVQWRRVIIMRLVLDIPLQDSVFLLYTYLSRVM